MSEPLNTVPESKPEIKPEPTGLNNADFLKIAVVVLAAAFILYRCLLPFRAEFAYREAFNAESGGQADLAIEKYLLATKFAPWETHYHVQLGKLYEDKARAAQSPEEKLQWIKKAEALYNHCLDISPDNPWYVNRMGEIYGLYASLAKTPAEQKELLKKREQAILNAADKDKNNALFQMSVAYLYHQQGDLKKAMEKYEHVLDIDDRFGEAYFNMADIYRQQGNINKQIEMYKKLIEKAPGFKNGHLQLGRIYEQQGKLNDAIQEYIEEVKIDKNNEIAFQILGAAFYRKQDWANVAKVYHRLSVIKPDNINYYLLHAQAAAKVGNIPEAIEAMESAQVLKPDDRSIAQNIQNMKNIINPPAKKPAAAAPAPTPTGTPAAPATGSALTQ